VVLGGRSHHGRAADVDLLDALVRACVAGNRLRERIEIANDQLEQRDAMLLKLGEMLRVVLVGQQAGLDLRIL
jgi:hypothetical protein